MHTFHETLCDIHRDYGNEKEIKMFFPYNRFRYAWYSYLNLLEIDYCSGFSCPKCTSAPEIILCDGTSLAFQRRMLQMPRGMFQEQAVDVRIP